MRCEYIHAPREAVERPGDDKREVVQAPVAPTRQLLLATVGRVAAGRRAAEHGRPLHRLHQRKLEVRLRGRRRQPRPLRLLSRRLLLLGELLLGRRLGPAPRAYDAGRTCTDDIQCGQSSSSRRATGCSQKRKKRIRCSNGSSGVRRRREAFRAGVTVWPWLATRPGWWARRAWRPSQAWTPRANRGWAWRATCWGWCAP